MTVDARVKEDWLGMPLDVKLQQRMRQALTGERSAAPPARAVDDAQRLFRRVQRLIDLNLVAAAPDLESLELACYAWQLPTRSHRVASGKIGRLTIVDRAEEAAELLIGLLPEQEHESLLERTTRILEQLPLHAPGLDEAKLLADAANLEDFGLTGLFKQAFQVAVQGDGFLQFIDGCRKRDAYGYWEARLRDGFHFELVKQIAQKRLTHARKVADLLSEELSEDQPRIDRAQNDRPSAD